MSSGEGPQFQLGTVHITKSIQDWLDEDPKHLVSLHSVLFFHQCKNWGILDQHDSDLQERCFQEDTQVMSNHILADGPRVYVFTLNPRSEPETTMCRPDEY